MHLKKKKISDFGFYELKIIVYEVCLRDITTDLWITKDLILYVLKNSTYWEKSWNHDLLFYLTYRCICILFRRCTESILISIK